MPRSCTCNPMIAIVTNIDNDHLGTHDGDSSGSSRASSSSCTTCRSTASRCCAWTTCTSAASCRRSNRPVRRLRFRRGRRPARREPAPRRSADSLRRGAARATGCALPVTVNLPGLHNVLNSLAAIAVALEIGMSHEAIQRALAQLPGHRPAADARRRRRRLAGRAASRDHRRRLRASPDRNRRDARCHPPGLRRVAAWCWRSSRIATRARAICSTISPRVLSAGDALLVTEVYAAGEAPIAAADGRAICRAVRTRGKVEPVFVEKVEDAARGAARRAHGRRRARDHGRGFDQRRVACDCRRS